MKLHVLFLFLLMTSFRVVSGQAYFQQEVNYTISVTLNDTKHSLKGFETIQYINNSPVTLKYLYFHLWPNAYKDRSTAFALQQIASGSVGFYYAREEDRGYIDSLEFRVDHKIINWIPDDFHIDICRLILNDPLAPGDTIVITTPFYVKIPGSFSRFGHVGQSYQISQWYPKPAVYDQHGWNQMPYLEQGEFYSEFGSFDVSITLPRNYVVGATGNLETIEELDWLERKTTDSTMVQNFPASDKILKTIRYTEKNIHDFAWFADKRYRVSKGEVMLPGNQKVTTWAMYTDKQAGLWKNAIEYINDALKYYSRWYGNYPYSNCSAVYGSLQSGGAMEYPTITVVGDASTPTMLEEFIMHEVGHNWFYGILGFNERRYPYLDEGINSFSEFRYLHTKYPGLKLYKMFLNNESLARKLNIHKQLHGYYYEYSFLLSARNNLDQPLNLPSGDYSTMNYGLVVYDKAALSFSYLMEYLGEEKFNQIMQQFYQKWQFKHPGPEELEQAFRLGCKEDLTWFFNDLLATTRKLDYAITRTRPDGVLVKNAGAVASPVLLTAVRNGSEDQSHWYPGFTGKQWLPLSLQSADKVVLFDSIWLPEIRQKNNTRRTHGPVKWVEPVNIHPFQILENPERTSIGIMPALGWNNYNKTLVGFLLYSPVIPQQLLEYQFVPMFGLGNHDIAGMGRISFNFYPGSSIFRAIQLSADARRFGYGIENGASYNKARGEVLFTFRNADARSQASKTLRFGLTGTSGVATLHTDRLLDIYFLTMDANYANHNILNPYRINLNAEVNKDYSRSSLELNYGHSMKYARDALHIRLFVSGFLSRGSNFSDVYAIQLSGSSGIHDYRYEHLFLGRFEDIQDENRQILLSQQFVMQEGGFVSNNPFAVSDSWLATVGATLRVPKTPLYVFANAGTYSGAGSTTWNISEDDIIYSENMAYEIGAMVNLGNLIKIYFPLLTSGDISRVNESLTGNYWQTIRYIIDFNVINPFKLKNRIF
jgi:hypothetical protein